MRGACVLEHVQYLRLLVCALTLFLPCAMQVSKYVNMGQIKFYFQVNTQYVMGKLRLLLLPMHMGGGSWVRIEKDGKSLPPRDDINAPDLYIPGSFC